LSKLRKTALATAFALALSTPAHAYSDEVVLAAIDLRITEIKADLTRLYAASQTATGPELRRVKAQMLGLIARKVQLLRASYYVRRLPEDKNAYIISCYNLQVASPSA
jgi:uncharacterized protein (DUF2342 family)